MVFNIRVKLPKHHQVMVLHISSKLLGVETWDFKPGGDHLIWLKSASSFIKKVLTSPNMFYLPYKAKLQRPRHLTVYYTRILCFSHWKTQILFQFIGFCLTENSLSALNNLTNICFRSTSPVLRHSLKIDDTRYVTNHIRLVLDIKFIEISFENRKMSNSYLLFYKTH